MIKYSKYAKLTMFLIASKTYHHKNCDSYYGIATSLEQFPCDSGLYLWDRGVVNADNRRRLSSMDSSIQTCRLLTEDELEQFKKELKGKYKFK